MTQSFLHVLATEKQVTLGEMIQRLAEKEAAQTKALRDAVIRQYEQQVPGSISSKQD